MKIISLSLLITISIHAPSKTPLTPKTKMIQEFMQTEEGKNKLTQLACIENLEIDEKKNEALNMLKKLPIDETLMVGNLIFTFSEYTKYIHSRKGKKETIKDKNIINEITNLVKKAKKIILIFGLNFQIQEILDGLKNNENKPQTYLFINWKDEGSLDPETEYKNIHKYYVKINEDHSFFHHKMIIIDFMHVGFGSLNFSLNAPINNCEDYFIAKTNPVYFSQQIKKYISSDNFQSLQLYMLKEIGIKDVKESVNNAIEAVKTLESFKSVETVKILENVKDCIKITETINAVKNALESAAILTEASNAIAKVAIKTTEAIKAIKDLESIEAAEVIENLQDKSKNKDQDKVKIIMKTKNITDEIIKIANEYIFSSQQMEIQKKRSVIELLEKAKKEKAEKEKVHFKMSELTNAQQTIIISTIEATTLIQELIELDFNLNKNKISD